MEYYFCDGWCSDARSRIPRRFKTRFGFWLHWMMQH